MSFQLPSYHQPDFSNPKFLIAPDAVCQPAPRDGVAPEQYHSTTIFPEYFKVGGQWLLAGESRMDSVAVLRDGKIAVVEFRNLKQGDQVFVGRRENCEDGIFVHTDGFTVQDEDGEVFAFRTGRSRETAYSRDYDFLYNLLDYERKHGYIVWVLGPACAFDYDSRQAFQSLVEGGYVHALLAGNALATHDLEAAYLGTALGQDIYSQKGQPGGHYNHIDTINRVRLCGSIPAFIHEEKIDNGIIYACDKMNVPFVLTGSIRDDGPLPEVYGDVYAGQNAMRSHISRATTVICMATALHTIATGNMTPSYRVMKDGLIRPTYFYSVDISEFAVNKLRDRGSLSVTTIVANVQDFIVHLQRGVNGRKDGE